VNSNKASTSNILKFFKPNKRAVFFVLLAILALGFSVKSSFAAQIPGPAPVPGQSLPPAWIEAKKNYTGTYQTNLNSWTSNDITPTSPNDYRMVLEFYGGYSWPEINKAGKDNTSSFISNPVNNSITRTYLGTTDAEVLEKWKAGQDAPKPSTSQQAVNDMNNGTRVVSNEVNNTAVKWIDAAALKVVITVLGVLATFCKILLMYAGQALDVTLNPNLYNFTSNQMVVGGWIIVRDVCNLFFLLVLLFIAICTILKIEKYHAKKTLLMLIIMALLINFSKPIAVFIFDGSQLLMNMFLSEITKNGGSPAAILAGDIAKFLYGDLMDSLASQPNDWTIAVYYLFVVVFLFMFAVALFVMFLFMMIRIVVVMILVIVSPLAFFAAIVPDFSKMSSSWWSALFEYSYYGPAAAFFLFLATKFAISSSNSTILPQINIQGGEPSAAGNLVIQHIIRYAVVLVFLYASIFMAKKFGGGAGAAITNWGDKALKGGWFRKGGWPREVVAWGSRTTGVTGGVSQKMQQSGWTRWMTAEGRKRNQKRREAGVASFLGVTGARTKRLKEDAENLKNESNANIIRMAEAGDMVAAFVASSRGILNENIVNAALPHLAGDADMRNEFVRNARKNGQAHEALRIRLQTPGLEDANSAQYNNPAAIAEHEITRVSTADLVKNQNIHQLAQIPEGLAALNATFNGNNSINARATNLAATPEQRASAQQQLNNIISEASAQNLNALRNNGLVT
jgi:hypothetical protein